MSKELKLWIYSSLVCGHRRVLLVADLTVGGAKSRLSGGHGSPSTKNAISSAAPGFPSWIDKPGAWISLVPLTDDPREHSLDRYSQDVRPTPPKVMPDSSDAYVSGENIRAAEYILSERIIELLKANHSVALLR